MPEALARRHHIVPLFHLKGVLGVAMADPLDFGSVDAAAATDPQAEPVIASRAGIDAAIDRWYGMTAGRQELLDELVAALRADDLATFQRVTRAGKGIILATGPTGKGGRRMVGTCRTGPPP